MKTYSIGEVSKLLNLSISTLRYYDKEGLLDSVERSEGGIRVFKEHDIRHLHMIECLKGTGMKLRDIKTFFEWCKHGDDTIEKRYQMFLERKADVERQIEDLQHRLDLIDYKCTYYRTAMEEGTLNTPKLDELERNTKSDSPYVQAIVGQD